MRGSVIPVFGRSARFTPIFINACPAIHVVIPMASNFEKVSE